LRRRATRITGEAGTRCEYAGMSRGTFSADCSCR
jgi:hypothetical protein